MTLSEARQRLAFLPGAFCIEYIDWTFRHPGEPDSRQSCWDVWDGKEHYQAPTLAEAVQKAVDANMPVPTEAERNLDVLLQLA